MICHNAEGASSCILRCHEPITEEGSQWHGAACLEKKHLVDHIADRNLCDDFQHSAPVQPRDAQAKRPGQVICSSNLALLYSKPRVLFTVGSHQLAEASPL